MLPPSRNRVVSCSLRLGGHFPRERTSQLLTARLPPHLHFSGTQRDARAEKPKRCKQSRYESLHTWDKGVFVGKHPTRGPCFGGEAAFTRRRAERKRGRRKKNAHVRVVYIGMRWMRWFIGFCGLYFFSFLMLWESMDRVIWNCIYIERTKLLLARGECHFCNAECTNKLDI